MQPLAITDLCPTQADAAAMSNLHSCVDRHGIFRRLRKAVVGQVSLKCGHASGMSVNPRLSCMCPHLQNLWLFGVLCC